jgi:hypothetical protein
MNNVIISSSLDFLSMGSKKQCFSSIPEELTENKKPKLIIFKLLMIAPKKGDKETKCLS